MRRNLSVVVIGAMRRHRTFIGQGTGGQVCAFRRRDRSRFSVPGNGNGKIAQLIACFLLPLRSQSICQNMRKRRHMIG